jgi:antitoxin component YwqK of YwqJK toxin-antitoxin module
MFEGNYENGQMNGTFTQWFDNGMIDYVAEYENGRPTGTWKYYRKDGSLISEQKMQ